VIASFADRETEDLFNGAPSKRARRRLPVALWTIAARKLDMLDAADGLADLRAPPSNRLEALRGDRAGQHSVRINDQYRICFVWTDAGPADVEITDYH
jgi:proteic killer suppression protein